MNSDALDYNGCSDFDNDDENVNETFSCCLDGAEDDGDDPVADEAASCQVK